MPSKLEEAIQLARKVVDALDKGQDVSTSLRQCERLARLTGDAFMLEYASRALKPGGAGSQSDLSYVRTNRNAKASGILRYLDDFQQEGKPVADQMGVGAGAIRWEGVGRSLPEIETLVRTARKNIKYTTSERDFIKSIEENEEILERVRNRVYRYATAALDRLLFENVPERVLDTTRLKVDGALAKMCPEALEKFRVAYDELAGASPENWTNVCTAVRRVLLDFANAVYPPRSEPVDGRAVGKDEYVNRLWAYAKERIASDTRREIATAELEDLGNRIDAVYALSNRGVHDTVKRDEAERILVRTYLLIADLL